MPPARVLIVEDDAPLASMMAEFLAANGFAPQVEGNGARAVERILAERPELVILDVTLPGKDGLAICREVRSLYPGRILMLTGRKEEKDQVNGLELGADDYVPKPVRPPLLLARVRALLRRNQAAATTSPGRIDVGNLVLDTAARRCTWHGQPLELTSGEFDLLLLLASHAGEVLSRDFILGRLRGASYDGLDRSMDLRVSRLRQKLGTDAIKTVRGTGYLLVRPPATPS